MKQFLREHGIVEDVFRVKELNNGSNIFDYIDPGSVYDVSLRKEKYFEATNRYLYDYIYLKELYDKNSILKGVRDDFAKMTTAAIAMPIEDGGVDIKWNKILNLSAKSLWDKYLNMVKTNRENGFKVNFDTVTEFGVPCAREKDYANALLLPGNKIIHFPYDSQDPHFRVYNMNDLTYRQDTSPPNINNSLVCGCCLFNNKVVLSARQQYTSSSPINWPILLDYDTFEIETSLNSGNGVTHGPNADLIADWGGFFITSPNHIYFYAVTMGQGYNGAISQPSTAGHKTILMPNGKDIFHKPIDIPSANIITINEDYSSLFFSYPIAPPRGRNGAVCLLSNEKVLNFGALDAGFTSAIGGTMLYDVYNKTQELIFPSTNPSAMHVGRYYNYNANTLLQDGRTLLAQYRAGAEHAGIITYDPYEPEETAIESVLLNDYGYSNAKLLSDGRVVLFPVLPGKKPIILSNSQNEYGYLELDENVYLSQYLNIGKQGEI